MATPIDRIASRGSTSLRAAIEADMAAVREIYAHYVLHSLATFEETPPTLEEMLARRRASVELGLPYLVAERAGEAVGFAYAAALSPASGLSVHDRGFGLCRRRAAGPRHRLGAARRIDHGLRARAVAPDARGRRRQRAMSARSRSIAASASSLRERCARSASSSGAGSTRRFCSGRYDPGNNRRRYCLSAAPPSTTPTIGPIGPSSSSRSSSGA